MDRSQYLRQSRGRTSTQSRKKYQFSSQLPDITPRFEDIAYVVLSPCHGSSKFSNTPSNRDNAVNDVMDTENAAKASQNFHPHTPFLQRANEWQDQLELQSSQVAACCEVFLFGAALSESQQGRCKCPKRWKRQVLAIFGYRLDPPRTSSLSLVRHHNVHALPQSPLFRPASSLTDLVPYVAFHQYRDGRRYAHEAAEAMHSDR